MSRGFAIWNRTVARAGIVSTQCNTGSGTQAPLTLSISADSAHKRDTILGPNLTAIIAESDTA